MPPCDKLNRKEKAENQSVSAGVPRLCRQPPSSHGMVLPLRKSIPPPRLMGTCSPGPSADLKDRHLPADAGFPHILFQRFSAHPRPIFRGTSRRSSGCSPCLQKEGPRGACTRLYAAMRASGFCLPYWNGPPGTAAHSTRGHIKPSCPSAFGRPPLLGELHKEATPPRGFPPTPNHSRPYLQSRDERRPAQRCAGIDSGR